MAQEKDKNIFQEQMAYMEALFENSPEAIVLLDNEERILKVNNEFSHLFGYSKKEVLGKQLNPLIIPEEYMEEGENFTRMVKEGAKISAESIRKRKDRTLIDVSILGTPVILKGEKIGVFAIYRDITEKKKPGKSTERERRKVQACG